MDNENIKIEIAQIGGIFNLEQSIKIGERILTFTAQGETILSRFLDNEQLQHIQEIASQALHAFGDVALKSVQPHESMTTHIIVDGKHVQFASGDEIPPMLARLVEFAVGLLPDNDEKDSN